MINVMTVPHFFIAIGATMWHMINFVISRY